MSATGVFPLADGLRVMSTPLAATLPLFVTVTRIEADFPGPILAGVAAPTFAVTLRTPPRTWKVWRRPRCIDSPVRSDHFSQQIVSPGGQG